MPKFIDLSGRKYGRWSVLNRVFIKGKKSTVYKCQCNCGTIRDVAAGDLVQGKSTSCGCFFSECLSNRNYVHGKSNTRTYRIWANMISRCENKNIPNFRNYGGRKIKVCKHWHTFENFFKDMGECPPNRSIDRINNNGNYEPGNCRWATRKEQAENKRGSIIIYYNGQYHSLNDWCDILSMTRSCLYTRLFRQKLSIPEAFEIPLRYNP